MKVEYTVHYTGVIDIDNSEWDAQTKENYGDDFNAFIFVYVQEEIRVWQGLTIDSIKDKP